jgi:hypothetical protein
MLTDLLNFSLQLEVLPCKEFNVVLHSFQSDIWFFLRIGLFSKLMEFLLQLHSVLTQISYQSFEFFNFWVLFFDKLFSIFFYVLKRILLLYI